MFNAKSLYALNKKDPNAIVYTDANGNSIRLTRDDFASEEAFLRWKAWSDEDFHTEDNGDVVEDKHSVSINVLSEEALTTPAVDVAMEIQLDLAEKQYQVADMVSRLRDRLTEKQFRRLWQHEVDGKTLDEIARQEGVAFQSIHESIESAKKKFLKIIKNTLKNCHQKDDR